MDTNGDGVVDASDNPNSPGTGTTTDAGCVPSSTTLSIKANGPDVTNLQNMLIRLGYSVGPQGADGDFGTNTQAAVIKFQQDNKLNPNGVVDSNTWTALCSSPISSSSNPTTNPTPGSPGQTSSAGYTICTRPNNDHKSLMTFINNPNASALDFLPRDKCLEYRNFQWDNNDYLGGTVGPNEKTKTIPMIEALKSVNPERRVTVTGDAILCVMCAADDPFIIVTSDGKRTISHFVVLDSKTRGSCPGVWHYCQNAQQIRG
jgi:peptidoglycan hydrolase-like protein with peptidoglycan-binding domain